MAAARGTTARAPAGPPKERESTADTPKNDGEETLEKPVTELTAKENRSKLTCLSMPGGRIRNPEKKRERTHESPAAIATNDWGGEM